MNKMVDQEVPSSHSSTEALKNIQKLPELTLTELLKIVKDLYAPNKCPVKKKPPSNSKKVL